MKILFFKTLLLTGVFLSIPSLNVHASESLKVDSVIVAGNKVTEAEIILRELTFKIGDTVNTEILKYNKERIYSLALFTSVRLRGIEKGDGRGIVFIDVEESWYIWPIPFGSIKDNTIKKLTYGVNLLYKNFRGRNETLSTIIGLGYDPSVSVIYSNPWLSHKNNIFFSTGFYYKSVENKSHVAQKLYGKEFDQKMAGFSLTLGKRLNLYNDVSFTGSFHYIQNPDGNKLVSFSGERIARIPAASISYTFDNRNLKQYPDSGFYGNITYTVKGFNIKDIQYSIIKADFRNYFQVWNDLSFKWRISGRYNSGKNIPYFDNPILGIDEDVRGYYTKEKEGDMLCIGSAEFRYPIIKDWALNLKLPIIPRQLTRYRIKVFVDIFADTGSAWFRDETISLKKLCSGYGAGLVFLVLPYNAIRFEYAINDMNKGEFVFGTGFSF